MKNFFEIRFNNIEPAAGRILISEPLLLDFFFSRSVVLLISHSKEEGTLGVILNKSIEVPFNSIIKDVPHFDGSIFLGGPVQTSNLFFLHTLGNKLGNSLKITNNLFWGGDIERVKELIEQGKIGKDEIRFFVGYAGWRPNQLENELKNNNWAVLDIELPILKLDPKEMWSRMVKFLGKEYSFWNNLPRDPQLN